MPGKLVSRMSKRECFTLSEKDTVKSASQKFHEKKIGCMPVVDENNKVTGILSERDLSRFIYAEKFNLTLPVSELMSKSLVTCDLNTSVTELMDEMTEKKIRHILIMENKKLLGIVSIGDVVKHLINKIEDGNIIITNGKTDNWDLPLSKKLYIVDEFLRENFSETFKINDFKFLEKSN